MKVFTLLGCIAAFTASHSAQANCDRQDFYRFANNALTNNPAMDTALVPFLDAVKASMEASEPLHSAGVTVVNKGEIKINSLMAQTGMQRIYVENIVLSNGVKVRFTGFTEVPADFNDTRKVMTAWPKIAPARIDAFGRILEVAHCVAQMRSYYDQSDLINMDTGQKFATIHMIAVPALNDIILKDL